ncbi:sialate O-acetylesterase [bacterium]|nr:sialate O-acetylesterase [bacterium]
MKRHLSLLFVTAAFACSSFAELRVAPLFQADMVLQREADVPVWGWADEGGTVTVAFAGTSATAVAGTDGAWKVTLGPFKASAAPAVLSVSTKSACIQVSNVLVGDVWLCSGQSNMQWPVRQTTNAEAEIADAQNWPQIRLATVQNVTAAEPRKDAQVAWSVCSTASAPDFSAAGYYFGRTLCKELGVPVGLIDSSWGGTPVEAWTSREMLETMPFLTGRLERADIARKTFNLEAATKEHEKQLAAWEAAVAKAKADGTDLPRKPSLWNPNTNPHQPACLFNAMINPLVPFAIKGAIWYQGEANAGRAIEYRTAFPAMIKDWRQRWGYDFPFLFVQLANFMDVQTEPSQEKATWHLLREAQFMTLSLPKTAMASAIDIGEARDIHSKNKQEVGRRLALGALAVAHGKPVEWSGPLYASHEVKGSNVVVSFTHLGGGLATRDGGALKGFAIAGEDKTFVWADARIDDGRVVVSAPGVAKPAAVRYSWANNPIGNLINKEGLPATSFRTDDWQTGMADEGR